MSQPPLLLTGVAGFIGRALADRLLEAGHEIVGVDSLEAPVDPRLKETRLATLEGRPGFRFAQIDLAEREATERLFGDLRPKHVIHLAARAGVRASMEEPHAYTRSNVEAFLNVLEGCRHTGCGHLVYASSSSVYGARSEAPFSERDPVDHPVSLYAATKRANELMAHSYAHLYGVPTTGLRFFTVYGPYGRPDMAVYGFTKAVMEGRPIILYEDGTLLRDFTYVDDIVEGIARLIDHPPSGDADGGSRPDRAAAPYRVLNIGNRNAVPVREMLAMIEEAVGREAIIRSQPMPLADVPMTCAATSELEAITGFQPQTPLREGIRRFVAWYRAFEEAGV
ncbi:NAD-dependent epimerase/dehydratase family protein [Terrihabitans sp. B22-R8]|uniref:NAD-dependent epimerase/dehydratase family protein n=1 Tax=Terrihabitans sp. B22-R8 TaxID=3425128 RepID=UPI00403C489F